MYGRAAVICMVPQAIVSKDHVRDYFVTADLQEVAGSDSCRDLFGSFVYWRVAVIHAVIC